MELDDAFALIARAIDTGTAANGYLIVGDLNGNALELTDRILHRLFPDDATQIDNRCHPDVIYLMPEGKSRTIHTASMRNHLIAPMGLTAYAGGWKVGIVMGADGMETSAANAFLKTLEEPTPQTMYLLLSDAPDDIMPTILSRCQRINLPLAQRLLEGAAYDDIAEVLNADVGSGLYEKAQAGKRLAEILSALKKEANDEDVPLVRKSFFRTIMSFVRNWMTENRLPRYQAFRNIEAVDAAARQSELYINDETVLTFLTDKLTFPTMTGQR